MSVLAILARCFGHYSWVYEYLEKGKMKQETKQHWHMGSRSLQDLEVVAEMMPAQEAQQTRLVYWTWLLTDLVYSTPYVLLSAPSI